MGINLANEAMRAFEECHSDTQNCGPTGKSPFYSSRNDPPPMREHVTDFESAKSLDTWPMRTVAAQLVALTELALHLCRKRTPCYQVRREQSRSSRNLGATFVPVNKWEFHFEVLDLWWKNPKGSPSVLCRENVLHPATAALIRVAQVIFKNKIVPKSTSYEEHNNLSEKQLQRNLIAQRMKEWFTLPANADRVKKWDFKHNAAKNAFLTEWGKLIQKSEFRLLRADLGHNGQTDLIQGFDPVSMPHSVVRGRVSKFMDLIKEDDFFIDCKCLVEPYADFFGNWQIPMIMLVPINNQNQVQAENKLATYWDLAVHPDRGEINYIFRSTLSGDYRFITNDQKMLDSIEHHLVRAATYIFDSRLIADTSIGTVSPVVENIKMVY